MTSSYHGNFWILIEKVICIVERWKKSIGYRFAPKCNHAQERLFSVTPFKIDQNKNQNHSTAGKLKEVNVQRPTPRFGSKE